MQYICRKMIEDGLMAKVIVPKREDDGLKAYIGDYWFYFGGSEFEHENPEKMPFGLLVEEIKNVLDSFYEHQETADEYLYYYYFLCENI